MRIKRVPSIPLITHDPYFSVWSSEDKLYAADTVHWSRKRQKMRGYVMVDEETYCFMGDKEFNKTIEQKWVDITATATEYYFENEKIGLNVKFTSPLLLDDMVLVSRPCTYVDFKVDKKVDCDVEIVFYLSSDFVSEEKGAFIIGDTHRTEVKGKLPAFDYAFMGKAFQKPLGNSGDNITIDWGYAYIATTDRNGKVYCDRANEQIGCRLTMSGNISGVIVAYDDLLSINYFGQWRKAYWTNHYESILEAIGQSFYDKADVCERAKAVDKDIEAKAMEAIGEDYALICIMAYRHSISAHKLITDEEGNILFLSKENDSNGCIGTVDVSYPSVPLYLMYNTEYVKGMLRPVFKFAECDSWEFDFAPHDVGRYPYAWGQVYGLNPEKWEKGFSGAQGAVFTPFYMYPKNSEIFDLKYQMPVEECGNMLILTSVVCDIDGNADFAIPYKDILEQWAKYLIEYGEDPGEQLCTDDFAGHLSHNVNLSAKAVMGLEGYSRLLRQMGDNDKADEYHAKAKEMAASWEKRADLGDHYALAFGQRDTWSLKYNLVWDKYFGSELFSDEVYEKEIDYYIGKISRYGTPIDSRDKYTKSDWILWCAAFAGSKKKAQTLIAPIVTYLYETNSRVPFSDWYNCETGYLYAFIARSVQGGLYMPIFLKERK